MLSVNVEELFAKYSNQQLLQNSSSDKAKRGSQGQIAQR
jgi:hypothetical protein